MIGKRLIQYRFRYECYNLILLNVFVNLLPILAFDIFKLITVFKHKFRTTKTHKPICQKA